MPPMSNFYARICVKATPSSNTDVLVSVSDSLIDHEFELADIIDRPRIELIEEWDPVVLVHGKADIKDRQSEVNLGLPELDKINIPCLTVLNHKTRRCATYDHDPCSSH